MKMTNWQMQFDEVVGKAGQTLVAEILVGTFFQVSSYLSTDSCDGDGTIVVGVEIGDVKQRWGRAREEGNAWVIDGVPSWSSDEGFHLLPRMDLCASTDTIRFHVRFIEDCTWHGYLAGQGSSEAAQETLRFRQGTRAEANLTEVGKSLRATLRWLYGEVCKGFGGTPEEAQASNERYESAFRDVEALEAEIAGRRDR